MRNRRVSVEDLDSVQGGLELELLAGLQRCIMKPGPGV